MRISDWSSDVCSSDLIGAMGKKGKKNTKEEEDYWASEEFEQDQKAVSGESEAGGDLEAAEETPGASAASKSKKKKKKKNKGKKKAAVRSEESRVGKECVSTCRSRWSQ